jgi:indolepyruvate ferredoxin oxidoreductase
MNTAAFRWGRKAAVDLATVEALVKPSQTLGDSRRLSENFDETVARRVDFLTKYQNDDYAEEYRRRVMRVQAAEALKVPGKSGLAEAVARNLFRLMAYKDEYEVARLYSEPAFADLVRQEVGGDKLRLSVHLSPPLLARRDPNTGRPRKMTFGPWVFGVFRVLARLKGLRGTVLDPFGWTEERRMERRLIADYRVLLDEILARLTPENHHLAVGLAAQPEKIRGFGFIKLRNLAAAKADEAALLEQFRTGGAPLLKAAE